MKKISLLLTYLLLPFFSHAQIALAQGDGTPITDGQIFTFNTIDEDQATFHYKIKNTSAFPINVRIKIVNIQNATGNKFQFCYLNSCLPSIAVNAIYPALSESPISIDANSETSSIGYNMWNFNPGTGTFPIDYVIKYYLVDDFNIEYGPSVTFTYRYDPNAILATNEAGDRQDSFAKILNTLVKNDLKVMSKENITYDIHNPEGRTVLKGDLQKGESMIDTSVLSKGIYILTLQDSKGKIISKKIIKE